jgi:hypothetical protein
MQRLTFSAGLLAAGMLMAVPAFAQSGGSDQGASGAQQPTTGQPSKQKTQTDVTNSYLFKPGSGSYAPRAGAGATKQQTDGEDVTGNNNFPAASK